jgi:hypothetical protein
MLHACRHEFHNARNQAKASAAISDESQQAYNLETMKCPSDATAPPCVDPVMLSSRIRNSSTVWQMPFYDLHEFSQFCRERGLTVWDETIRHLWKIGLLRADLVLSSTVLHGVRLVELGPAENGFRAYADGGRIRARTWSRVSRTLAPGIKLYFHPFRFLVVARYIGLCQAAIPPVSVLQPLGQCKQFRQHLKRFQTWSASESIFNAFADANNTASLAIAAEPRIYPRIALRERLSSAEENSVQVAEEMWAEVETKYRAIGEESLRQTWERINRASSTLEPNTSLHEKLRLAKSRLWGRQLRGPLAGALFLRTIAEVIRRAAEKVFDTEWPEEGETWSNNAAYKRSEYGSHRIFDSSGRTKDQVLKEFWPDFGISARFYVEGETELGAFQHVFGKNPSGIDVICLRANFDRRLPILWENDRKNGIYSFVVLDGDKHDPLRLLVNATKASRFFGVWYCSKPDLEFGNFDLEELQEILWRRASASGASSWKRGSIMDATKHCRSGKELEKCARNILGGPLKGIDWGRHLMAFAMEHPLRKGKDRPIVAMIRDAISAAQGRFHYQTDFTAMRVDSQTGRLEPKA